MAFFQISQIIPFLEIPSEILPSLTQEHKAQLLMLFDNMILTSDGNYKWPALQGQQTSMDYDAACQAAVYLKVKGRTLLSRRAVRGSFGAPPLGLQQMIDSSKPPPLASLNKEEEAADESTQ